MGSDLTVGVWIGLLRGVNVSGNRLPMAELREELAGLGLERFRTYIQTGNVVFEATPEAACELAAALPARIEERFGFEPVFLVLSTDELRAAIAANPYPGADERPRTLHLYFLAERPPAPDVEALDAACAESESWHLEDRVFYLHAPEGFGWSKLGRNAEELLGVPATARNWRTVTKLRELAETEGRKWADADGEVDP